MSLINDALKRATQTPPPAVPPAGADPSLRPVEYHRPSTLPLVLVPLLLLAIFSLAAWLFYEGWKQSRRAKSANADLPVAARHFPANSTEPSQSAKQTKAEKPPRTEPLLPGGPRPSQMATAPAPTETAPPATNPPAPVAPAPPPKPTFPVLKLQGIFYRPSNPSAVINSKTVYRGDKIERAKVVNIEADSVTVEWEGQTKVLTLQ